MVDTNPPHLRSGIYCCCKSGADGALSPGLLTTNRAALLHNVIFRAEAGRLLQSRLTPQRVAGGVRGQMPPTWNPFRWSPGSGLPPIWAESIEQAFGPGSYFSLSWLSSMTAEDAPQAIAASDCPFDCRTQRLSIDYDWRLPRIQPLQPGELNRALANAGHKIERLAITLGPGDQS